MHSPFPGPGDMDSARAFLAELPASVPEVSESTRRAFRQAAAVFVSLRQPQELKPFGEAARGISAEQALATDLVPSQARVFHGEYVLGTDARRAALLQLDVRQIEQALASNAMERSGPGQAMYERFLRGEDVDAEALDVDELEMAVQLLTWLRGVRPIDEKLARLRSRLDYLRFLAPFQELASDDRFVGRTSELDQLRQHVGVVKPSLLATRLRAAISAPFQADRPALTVYGPGGVGKSTLVARFALEHLQAPLAARIPLAYLDFDRADRDIADVTGLAAEVVRQVAAQRSTGSYDKLVEAAQAQARRLQRAADVAGTDVDLHAQAQKDAHAVLRSLLDALREDEAPGPLVLVLDSFEEVQYRNEALAHGLWQVLQMLQDHPFGMRVVISGRAPVQSLLLNDRPAAELEVGELDAAAARAFLARAGFDDAEETDAIIRLVGGVPLSLVLASTLLKKAEAGDGGALEGISGKRRFWFSTADELIQGQLYERILGHVHNERLKALAHPGLVLRRVTPEVILHVLDAPCHLGLQDLEEAQRLFEELKRETSLVSIDDVEGAVVHRRDLRNVMLGLITSREPERVRSIHEAGARWYGGQATLRARAEACYHRLHLGWPVPKEWLADQEIRSSIQASINDFTPEVQRQLLRQGFRAERSGTSLDRSGALASFIATAEAALPHGPSALHYIAQAIRYEHQDERSLAMCLLAWKVFAQLGEGKEEELWKQRADARVQLEPDLQVRMDYLSAKCWDLQLSGKAIELIDQEYLDGLRDYARRSACRWAAAQAAFQRMANVSDLRGRFYADAASALGSLDALELWFVFPAFALAAERLLAHDPARNSAMWLRLARVISHPDSPFPRAQFGTTAARRALLALVSAARAMQDDPAQAFTARRLAALRQGIQHLSDAWPYKVLKIQPPYGSSGPALRESAA